MTELEKVWLACALDCEGSVGFYRTPERRTYQAQVVLGNTNYDLVMRCKSITNKGRVTLASAKSRPHCKPYWWWRVSNFSDCLKILQAVYPYLIAKQGKAMRTIVFCKYKLRRKWQRETISIEEILDKGSEQDMIDIVDRFRL